MRWKQNRQSGNFAALKFRLKRLERVLMDSEEVKTRGSRRPHDVRKFGKRAPTGNCRARFRAWPATSHGHFSLVALTAFPVWGVARGPKQAGFRGQYPGAWYPVVVARIVRPEPRRPDIPLVGAEKLALRKSQRARSSGETRRISLVVLFGPTPGTPVFREGRKKLPALRRRRRF